jgi:hypothetical protein
MGRWYPPEDSISPTFFIPIAEMTGTIVPIGIRVFHQGCLAEVDWRNRWEADAPYNWSDACFGWHAASGSTGNSHLFSTKNVPLPTRQYDWVDA